MFIQDDLGVCCSIDNIITIKKLDSNLIEVMYDKRVVTAFFNTPKRRDIIFEAIEGYLDIIKLDDNDEVTSNILDIDDSELGMN